MNSFLITFNNLLFRIHIIKQNYIVIKALKSFFLFGGRFSYSNQRSKGRGRTSSCKALWGQFVILGCIDNIDLVATNTYFNINLSVHNCFG